MLHSICVDILTLIFGGVFYDEKGIYLCNVLAQGGYFGSSFGPVDFLVSNLYIASFVPHRHF